MESQNFGQVRVKGAKNLQSDNVFDKTQSTVGEAHLNGEPFSARTNKDEANNTREFTPLKDKLGQSFFED